MISRGNNSSKSPNISSSLKKHKHNINSSGNIKSLSPKKPLLYDI